MSLRIKDIANVVESYQNYHGKTTRDMCKIMGMNSTSTYSGFINKEQNIGLEYLLNFVNETGIVFDQLFEVFDRTNGNVSQTQSKDAAPPKPQNYCSNKRCIEEITLLKRNNENLLNYIDELKEKMLRYQSEKGDKPFENVPSGGVEKARRTG